MNSISWPSPFTEPKSWFVAFCPNCTTGQKIQLGCDVQQKERVRGERLREREAGSVLFVLAGVWNRLSKLVGFIKLIHSSASMFCIGEDITYSLCFVFSITVYHKTTKLDTHKIKNGFRSMFRHFCINLCKILRCIFCRVAEVYVILSDRMCCICFVSSIDVNIVCFCILQPIRPIFCTLLSNAALQVNAPMSEEAEIQYWYVWVVTVLLAGKVIGK